MRLHVHPENPGQRHIQIIKECLLDGGIIIYPTDTIYGLGCNIFQHTAVERICRIKNIDPKKAQLSFICNDLSHLSQYTKQISTPLYRILKHYLPGPFTFILPASKEVPGLLQTKKKTIGLRIPANPIPQSIAAALGHPLLSTSLPGADVADNTDPDIIENRFENIADIIVDGGPGGIIPSAIIDATSEKIVVVREGPLPFYDAD